MADARRTKRSRLEATAGRARPPPAAEPRAEAVDAAPDDDAERALGRMFGLGVPVVGVGGALILGAISGLPQALLVLAGAALLGTIGFFWASLRTLSGDAPLGAGVASHALVSRVPAPERKRETLRALKDLEFEHSIGKIDDADFRELQGRYRSTAKALMREIDAGLAPRREEAERLVAQHLAKRDLGPANAEVTAVPVAVEGAAATARSGRVACPKCTTSNEPDASFCKKCGTALSEAQAAQAAEDAPDAAV